MLDLVFKDLRSGGFPVTWRRILQRPSLFATLIFDSVSSVAAGRPSAWAANNIDFGRPCKRYFRKLFSDRDLPL